MVKQPILQRRLPPSRRSFAIVAAIATISYLYACPAWAQITFVKNIGTASSNSTGTSLVITAPAAGVAAGNSVIVSLAMDPAAGTVSCSDTRGNSYNSNRDVNQGSGTNGLRTVVLSAHNIVAMTSADTITCTHPSVAARALSANEFSGLAASATVDRSASATGNNSAPSSGATATTNQAAELLIGAIGVEGPSTETFTPGAGYTSIGRVGTSGGTPAANITINPEYQIVNATGAYTATGTLSSSRRWAAAIVTYRAALVATNLVVSTVNGGNNPTAGVGFPIVVRSVNVNGTPTNVISATNVSLSLKTGTGTLGGTLTGTIAAGSSQVVFNPVTYTKAESGVVVTATRTSGDNLTAGDSTAFTVNPGAANKLAFLTPPGNSTAGSPLSGPPSVVVQDSLGNTVTSSTASITVAIGTNPGSGTLSGTTMQSGSGGIASFTDLTINSGGTGYTLVASSSGLASATSAAFNVTALSPDLVVTSVSNPPASALIGGSFSVTDTTANSGNGTAGVSTTKYRLSLDNIITTGDVLLTGTRSIPTLAASANSSGSSNITIPAGLAVGAYYLGACADDDNTIAESNEANNCLASTTTVVVNAAPPAGSGVVYIYDRLNRLRAVVDLATDTGIYNYDSVGNLLSIVRQSSAVVSIIEISKNSGPAGTSITVYGTGFSTTCGQNLVTFNGMPATVSSCTATQIVTSVPVGATNGAINVTAPGGSASSSETFNVTPTSGGPIIASFTPTIGAAGDSVTITGSGFQTAAVNNRVTFNAAQAFGLASTASSITTAVPDRGTSGRVKVATPLGQSASTDDFFIPPYLQKANDVGSTARINIGASANVTIPVGKNIGMLVFDGNQGQQVTVNVSSVSFVRDVILVVQAPDGTVLLVAAVGAGGGPLTPVILPVTGTYTISVLSRILTRIAGGYGGGDGGPAISAHIDGPTGLSMDSQGNLYFADYYNHRIRKVDTNGIITSVAGDGNPSYGGDGGFATAAQLQFPWAVASDPQGNLFISDFDNHRVRKVSSSGIVTTVAGNGVNNSAGDGILATSASLNGPSSAVVDSQGNLFVAEYHGNRVRKVGTNGIITTVAGTGVSGFSGDGGLGTSAQLARPTALSLDALGNLYIADYGNNRVRKLDVGGVISTIAGTGTPGFSGDGGLATNAQLNRPAGVTFDTQGQLLITEEYNHRVRRIDSLGVINTIAGVGTSGFSGDGGPALNAQFSYPWATFVDASGNLYVSDSQNDRIRKIDPNGNISSIAGSDDVGDGGLAKNAIIDYPTGVAIDPLGNVYVADYGLSRVRKISPDGTITTVVGDGIDGNSGDGGPATSAQINGPWQIALDNQGNLYIADYSNDNVRKVGTNGIITTIAAQLNGPEGVAVDSLGNVYVANTFSHRIEKIDSNGVRTTYAGTGSSGYSGDGGPAIAAQFYYPIGLAVDANNNLYVADERNHRIRKIDPAGIVTTVAGNGTFGFGGENIPAINSSLSFPQGVAVDGQGNIYIAEERNYVLKVDANGIISRLAGNGVWGYNGDNKVPSTAQVAFPTHVAVDSQGNIFIADSDNFYLRAIYANVTGSLSVTLTTP